MKMKTALQWFAAVLLTSFVATGTAWALPTEAEVQAQVKAGQFGQAEQSMAEVVAAKPDSAKAHYLYAQILAHRRKFDEAATHAQRAKALDPALKFTQPEKFKAFETLIQREQHPGGTKAAAGTAVTPLPGDVTPLQAPAAAPAERSSPGVPGWVWGAGLVVIAVLLWKAVSRGLRSPVAGAAAQMPVQAPVGGYGGFGNVAPGAYGGPVQPLAGNGLRTGLAAGAGLAGGLAAGVLLDQMLHRGDTPGGTSHGADAGAAGAGGGLLGGVEPGYFDRELQQDAADQLASRDIDFGNGDGWDDGGSSSSGSGGDDW